MSIGIKRQTGSISIVPEDVFNNEIKFSLIGRFCGQSCNQAHGPCEGKSLLSWSIILTLHSPDPTTRTHLSADAPFLYAHPKRNLNFKNTLSRNNQSEPTRTGNCTIFFSLNKEFSWHRS